jgi:FecR protein
MTARTSLTRVAFSVILGLAVLSPAASARAQSSSNTRAARLTFMQGAVSVAEADNPAGVPAQLNLPLLSGVQLITGTDGQAEVEFEDGSIIRLTPNSALSLDSLTVQPDGVFLSSLGLLRGLAYCELRATQQYRYTLEAGGDVLSPVENTTVRVNFDEPPATFSVLDGTAQVERQSAQNNEAASAGYQTQVRAGETLREDPTDANRYFLTQQIAEDSWDQWSEERDHEAASEAADSTPVRNDYAGAQGYGWSDLDANGSWYNVPGQGPVWQPQVAVDDSGFDPYGNGAWVWYPNTGYLWASSYAWGWTPYRCGNWSYYNSFGWGWAPGTGCGGFGWGFAGGGRPVNIVLGPTGYRPIRVPLAGGPRRIQPTLPVQVKAWQTQEPSRGDQSGPRRIAGVTVVPIKPIAQGSIGDDSHPSSSLRRDFPIDSATRNPVLGIASTSPAVVRPTSALRSNQGRPANLETPPQAQRQPAPYTPYSGQPYPADGQYRGAPQTNPAQPSDRGERPVDRGSPRPAPQPAQPTYTPRPQAPPPASHPTYSPPRAPAAQPASHPQSTESGHPSPK